MAVAQGAMGQRLGALVGAALAPAAVAAGRQVGAAQVGQAMSGPYCSISRSGPTLCVDLRNLGTSSGAELHAHCRAKPAYWASAPRQGIGMVKNNVSSRRIRPHA